MLINIRVIPRSAKNALEWENNGMKAHLTAPPIDGAANKALVALLAERLGLPKRAITIIRGTANRQKTVEITGMTVEEVQQKVNNTSTH